MKRKTALTLLSILHICIFLIGMISFYYHSQETVVTAMPDTTISLAEPETLIEVETKTNPEIESTSEIESMTEPECMIEPETEIESEHTEAAEEKVLYTFVYSEGTRNLNIRKGPSLNDEIIGKIPRNGKGDILEFVNDEWALVKYNETIGYCNLHWMSLNELRGN